MTNATTSATNSSSIYASLGLTNSGSTSASSSSSASAASAAFNTSVNEQDFLTLMTAQLQDQDPMNPVSNADFFSQIAQFSTVSGINQLNSSFTQLSSQMSTAQTLQAANLIGQSVLVPGSKAQLGSSGLTGGVQVPASGDVTVTIKNSSGNVVNTLDLGTQSAGTVPFTWNGQDANGNTLPTGGTYTISAQVGSGSTAQTATTDVAAQVLSVSVNSGTLTLNLEGQGQVPYSSVQQIL